MTPDLQVFFMLCTNIGIAFLIIMTLRLGFPTPRWPPALFFLLEGILIGMNFIGGYTESFSPWRIAAKFRGQLDTYTPGWRMQRWKTHSVTPPDIPGLRELISLATIKGFVSLRGVTWLSTGLAFWSCLVVVNNTGGSIESPYAPLLIGPAVFGPLVVSDPRAIFVLGAGAITWVLAADANADRALHPANHAHWLVYALVTIVLAATVLAITFILITSPKLPKVTADVPSS